MPKKGGGRDVNNLTNEMLDALVEAIEGASSTKKNNSKKGMTKKQVLALDEKKVNEAIVKAIGDDEALLEHHRRMDFLTQRIAEENASRESQYVNVIVPLKEEQKCWQEVEPQKYIRYEQFDGSDDAMEFLVNLFSKELSEPYSSFTHEYFVFGWPDLTVITYGVESETPPDSSVRGRRVGAVVSRVKRKGVDAPLKGYVAMIAVVPEFRRFKLGSRLVALTVELMREKGCEEVYLETPLSNERALALYQNLGFAKTKFLPRYYLDHSDAVRLKLWINENASCLQSGCGPTS